MSKDLITDFLDFDAANPQIWKLVLERTFEVIGAGYGRFAIDEVFNRIRWFKNVETYSDDEFKVNDHHRAFYARKFMQQFPQYAGFFEVRPSIADTIFDRKDKLPKHECHWPTCDREVPSSAWGCRKHWGAIPTPFRSAILAGYKQGIESSEYRKAMKVAADWIENHHYNL